MQSERIYNTLKYAYLPHQVNSSLPTLPQHRGTQNLRCRSLRAPGRLHRPFRNTKPHSIIPHFMSAPLLLRTLGTTARSLRRPPSTDAPRSGPTLGDLQSRIITSSIVITVSRLALIIALALHSHAPLRAHFAQAPVAELVYIALLSVGARVSASLSRAERGRLFAERPHVEWLCRVNLTLEVWRAVNDPFAPILGSDGRPDDTLLTEAVFAGEMLEAGVLAVAVVADLSRLLFIGNSADAVFADEVGLAAIGAVTQVTEAAKGAVGLAGGVGVHGHVGEV